jgi:hypothetical protein
LFIHPKGTFLRSKSIGLIWQSESADGAKNISVEKTNRRLGQIQLTTMSRNVLELIEKNSISWGHVEWGMETSLWTGLTPSDGNIPPTSQWALYLVSVYTAR